MKAISFLGMIWVLTAVSVRAQGPNPPPPPPRSPLVSALDADGDGTISAAEMRNATAALAKLDKNGDGQLEREEFDPRPERGGPGGNGGRGHAQPPGGGRP